MSATELINGPTELPRYVDWRDLAVCSGQMPLFFARKAERPQARARREHKAGQLCDRCPVKTECREYARENRLYGFWGGESEDERHSAGYSLTAPIGIRRGPEDHTESAAS